MAWYAPYIVVPHLMVPEDYQRLAAVDGGGDPTAVNRAHRHLISLQHAHRLVTRLPPRHMGLEPIEHSESAVKALLGGERSIHLIRRYAIGDQCPLQIAHRRAAQATPSGVALQVEEILQPYRRLLKAVTAIADHGRTHHIANATGRLAEVDEILLGGGTIGRGRQGGSVEMLQQALVAGANGVKQLQVNHVPVHVPGPHLFANAVDAAGVLNHLHAMAGLRLVGTYESQHLTLHVGTVPGHNVECLLLRPNGAGCKRQYARERGDGAPLAPSRQAGSCFISLPGACNVSP